MTGNLLTTYVLSLRVPVHLSCAIIFACECLSRALFQPVVAGFGGVV